MKVFFVFLLGMFFAGFAYGQASGDKDTSNQTGSKKAPADGNEFHLEQVPQFPGGNEAFSKYLGKNLRYPTVARLLGIGGRLVISFVVDRDGRVIDAKPINCIGAGCEAEAVRLLEASPVWKPGMQDGKQVRVQYSVPINFSMGNGKETTYISDLRNSPYGFVFNIKGVLYTIDEAQKILGRHFPADQIELAEPFYNYNKVEKFEMPDKKEVYLLIFKKP